MDPKDDLISRAFETHMCEVAAFWRGFKTRTESLGWNYYGIPGHIEVPGKEKTCFYSRKWSDNIPQGVVVKDFLYHREMISRKEYDYIIFIYSPGASIPSEIFDAPTYAHRLAAYNLDFHSWFCAIYNPTKSQVAQEFDNYLEQSSKFQNIRKRATLP